MMQRKEKKWFTFGIFGLFTFPPPSEGNGDGVDTFPFSRIAGGDDARSACWGDTGDGDVVDDDIGWGVRGRPPVDDGCWGGLKAVLDVWALEGCSSSM